MAPLKFAVVLLSLTASAPLEVFGGDCGALLAALREAEGLQVQSPDYQRAFNQPACQADRTLLASLLDPNGPCAYSDAEDCQALKRQAFWQRRACDDTAPSCLAKLSPEAQAAQAAKQRATDAGCIPLMAAQTPPPGGDAGRSPCGSFPFYPLCDAVKRVTSSASTNRCEALLYDAFFAMCDIGSTPAYGAWMQTSACQTCLVAYRDMVGACFDKRGQSGCAPAQAQWRIKSAQCDLQASKCAFFDSNLFARVRAARQQMQRLDCRNVFGASPTSPPSDYLQGALNDG